MYNSTYNASLVLLKVIALLQSNRFIWNSWNYHSKTSISASHSTARQTVLSGIHGITTVKSVFISFFFRSNQYVYRKNKCIHEEVLPETFEDGIHY